jgi:peptide/nickel transport system ATP-binding protein
MPRALEITDLSTHIALRRSVVQAVGDVSLHIDAGETLGLVGESGCGKSMTGLSILGLLPPGGSIVSGSIKLDGRELVGLSASELRSVRGNDVATVFQDSMTSLNPTRTIGYQVAEPVRRHLGASRREARARAIEVLGLVGLPRPSERLDDYPHQLSGGLRQRVLIAMALACEPKVLIADEPTTALDVTIQAQILDLLDDLKARLGMAVLLITHDMGVVAGHADRVNVMYAGRMVEATGTEQLFASMHHPYTQGLLASIPQLDQDGTQPLHTIPGIPPDLAYPPQGCRFSERCPRATDHCRAVEPPLLQIERTPEHAVASDAALEHLAACWHPVDGPVKRQEADPVVLAHHVHILAAEQRDDAKVRLLDVHGLVKEYPVTSGAVLRRRSGSVKAVSDVSFSVNRGETFGLVGESGCGKSTIGRMVVALEHPDRGVVTLSGDDLTTMSGSRLRGRRRDLQLMFQDPHASLDPRMRVGAILREPLVIQGIGNRKEQDERVRELLGEVGLPQSSVERYPHEFSGGQRQRIGLARALALNPQLIVADEPVSALDVSIRSQVLNLMKRLQAAHDLSYVVISHDLAVVKYLADRVGVMYLGQLVEVGPSEEVYARPAHHYTAGLIDTVPIPDPQVQKRRNRVGIRGELPSPVNPPSGCRFRTRCPAAQDVCAQVAPPMVRYGEGHWAACHFPLQRPLDAEVAPDGRTVATGSATSTQ